jgi:hypothetical protein
MLEFKCCICEPVSLCAEEPRTRKGRRRRSRLLLLLLLDTARLEVVGAIGAGVAVPIAIE